MIRFCQKIKDILNICGLRIYRHTVKGASATSISVVGGRLRMVASLRVKKFGKERDTGRTGLQTIQPDKQDPNKPVSIIPVFPTIIGEAVVQVYEYTYTFYGCKYVEIDGKIIYDYR